MDAVGILQGNLGDVVVVADHLVGPCPLVFAIVGINLLEAADELLDGFDGSILQVGDDAVFLAYRQEESGEVIPVAGTYLRGRRGDGRIALQYSLQHGTHVDAQGDIVVFDALVERCGWDDVFVVEILRNVVARHLAQVLQYLLALQDFAYGERREPIEVDDALAVFLCTEVALRPFLDVAVQAHGGDVSARDEEHLVAIGNEIGERQVAGVGVVHQLAEAYGERTQGGWHQQVGTAGCLRTALQDAPVHRTHLVGVVGEVGC